MPPRKRDPSSAAQPGVSRIAAVFTAEGTPDRRCGGSDFRLYVAERLAAGIDSDQSDIRAALAEGSSGTSAGELGGLRIQEERSRLSEVEDLYQLFPSMFSSSTHF